MKFYVRSGSSKFILSADNVTAAAEKFLHLVSENDKPLGEIILVSEVGFDADHDDDQLMGTLAFLDKLHLEGRLLHVNLRRLEESE